MPKPSEHGSRLLYYRSRVLYCWVFSFLAAPKEQILAISSRRNKSAATEDRPSGCPPRSPRRSVIDINCWSTSICGESQLNFITVAVPGQKRISISINCVPESDRRWQRSRGRVSTSMCTTSASMVQYRPKDFMTLLRARMTSSFIVSAYFDLLTYENREHYPTQPTRAEAFGMFSTFKVFSALSKWIFREDLYVVFLISCAPPFSDGVKVGCRSASATRLLRLRVG